MLLQKGNVGSSDVPEHGSKDVKIPDNSSRTLGISHEQSEIPKSRPLLLTTDTFFMLALTVVDARLARTASLYKFSALACRLFKHIRTFHNFPDISSLHGLRV